MHLLDTKRNMLIKDVLCFPLQDLCDRHEKGVLLDHQRAIQKMGQYKKKKMSATIQGPSEVTSLAPWIFIGCI